MYKKPLVKHFDTSHADLGDLLIAIVMLGLSAAVGGTWVERSGPRKAMFVAACCWALRLPRRPPLGIATDQLWLVYLGYGVIGGIGLGIGYISPVSTLIKWFPDRPGLATGLAIMGFGGGALVAGPLSDALARHVRRQPRPTRSRRAFLTLGAIYFVIMMFGAFNVRVPADGWRPEGSSPAEAARAHARHRGNVSAANAIRTPQFWLLWVVLFCNVTAGIGILEQAAR